MQGDKYSVPSKARTLFQVRGRAGGVLRLAGSLLASPAGNSDDVFTSSQKQGAWPGESLFAFLKMKRSSGKHRSSALQ